MQLNVKLLHPDARLPTYATDGSVGLDLYAIQEGLIMQNVPTRIRTGLAMVIPKGFGGIIKPRSGWAVKAGTDVCAGVIDDDYRGEIIVVLKSSIGEYPYAAGERIAQMVIVPVLKPKVIEVTELDETDRGEGGFGSTDWIKKPVVHIKGYMMHDRLYGVVRNHPHVMDGDYVQTSPVIRVLSENMYETFNTVYRLERTK